MKKAFLLILLATTFSVASAQLKVTSDGKVKIASNSNTSFSNLLVGNNYFYSSISNVGISGSPTVMTGMNNIGVVGIIGTDPSSSGGWAGFYGKLILGYIKYSFGNGPLEDKAYGHDHGRYSW